LPSEDALCEQRKELERFLAVDVPAVAKEGVLFIVVVTGLSCLLNQNVGEAVEEHNVLADSEPNPPRDLSGGRSGPNLVEHDKPREGAAQATVGKHRPVNVLRLPA